MRIVLVPASAPLICVYCHDVLGTGSLERCTKCATRYHKECAGLAGVCGLIGCDGAFESASAPGAIAGDARLALVVAPPGRPTKEQLAAVARVLQATEWDARQRLASHAPLVLGYFAQKALAHATADLDAAGLSTLAIDAASLASAERFLVKSIERLGEALILRNAQGVERHWKLGTPILLVSARYASEIDDVRETRKQLSENGGNAANAFRTKKTRTHTTTFSKVLYAYSDASTVVFDEAVIDDFRFLGVKMSPSSTQNFAALATLLGEGAGVVDRSLEKQGASHMRHLPESTLQRDSRKSNLAYVDAASLLIYHFHVGADEPEKGA